MELNTLSPAEGSVKSRKRVGRGIGCGNGKTCGRGHKGQHSRSGGFHKTGFEGGQMPLQRRLPKVGFRSRKKLVTAEICLNDLAKIDAAIITINTLKEAGLVNKKTLFAKVIKSGEIDKAVKLSGIRVSKGAMDAIKAAGGSVEA